MSRTQDITLSMPEGAFNMRVGSIIINDDKVLLVNNGVHYYSVGGRVKLHETLEQAIVREVFEETGENFEADRLVWINESFFTIKGGMNDGTRCHEMCFTYLMKPRPDASIDNGHDINDSTDEWLEWVSIDQLSECIVYPEEFKTGLRHLPDYPIHIMKID